MRTLTSTPEEKPCHCGHVGLADHTLCNLVGQPLGGTKPGANHEPRRLPPSELDRIRRRFRSKRWPDA